MEKENITEQELIDMRFSDIGYTVIYKYVIISSEIEGTEQFEQDENWIELNKQSVLDMILINELFSLKKEVKSGTGKRNYVYVKMKNKNLSAQEAVDEIMKETAVAMDRTHYHGQKLKEKKIEILDQYVDAMYEFVDGNRYWHKITARYKI